MPNLLQTGAAWLADQLKTHASTEVIYQRGADQVAVSATIGKTEFEIDDDEFSPTDRESSNTSNREIT